MTPSPDSFLFFTAIFLGFLFGVYYEIFRFLRLCIRHPFWMVFLEDLLFFLPTSLASIFFHYALSDGVMRWFSLLGVVMGFLLYLGTLGRIIVFFSDVILKTIKKILRGIYKLLFKLLFRPILIVFKNITNCLYAKYKKRSIMIKRKRNARVLKREKTKLLKRAQKGFSN